MDERQRVQHLLETSLPRGAIDDFREDDFREDDFNKLAESGYTSLGAFQSANLDLLLLALPGRYGIVGVLLKNFVASPSGYASKRSKTTSTEIQLFVKSAANSYRKWEEDYNLALEKSLGVAEDMHRPFLEVESDPLCNFAGGYLLWVGQCYTELKDIMVAILKPGARITILGTSGIGKSLFTVFWICYRATLKEKIVWKRGENKWYLLDFTVERSAKAYGPLSEDDGEIQEVLNDKNAWLVIDGRQAEELVCRCHVVHACSMRKENYHEYTKNQRVNLHYFPVWEEEEVREFLDEFEQHRLEYNHMEVPVKDAALDYFRKIGGVPRYVLCGLHSERRLNYIRDSVAQLGKDSCLEYFAGNFDEGVKSDAFVHIECGQSKDKYSDYIYDFASIDVRRQFRQRFEHESKVDVCIFHCDWQ